MDGTLNVSAPEHDFETSVFSKLTKTGLNNAIMANERPLLLYYAAKKGKHYITHNWNVPAGLTLQVLNHSLDASKFTNNGLPPLQLRTSPFHHDLFILFTSTLGCKIVNNESRGERQRPSVSLEPPGYTDDVQSSFFLFPANRYQPDPFQAEQWF